MTKAIWCLLAAAALVVAAERSDPVDNEFVRVLDVTEQPRVKTSMHKHDVNRVMIYLDSGKQKFQWEGGKESELHFQAGAAVWSPAGGNHVADLTSDNPVRIIDVELKKVGAGKNPAAPAKDPLKVAPKNYKVEIENDQVRVVRVKFAPGETVPMHEHATNRVSVALGDQDFRITTADGQVQLPKRKRGEAAWGTPVTHKEENLSNQPFELIMIDLKY